MKSHLPSQNTRLSFQVRDREACSQLHHPYLHKMERDVVEPNES
jgi:hypothetical protein